MLKSKKTKARADERKRKKTKLKSQRVSMGQHELTKGQNCQSIYYGAQSNATGSRRNEEERRELGLKPKLQRPRTCWAQLPCSPSFSRIQMSNFFLLNSF